MAPRASLNTNGNPLAFGKSVDNGADFEIPGLGKLGIADSYSTITKFIPEGSDERNTNGGQFKVSKGNEKYTSGDSAAGRSSFGRNHFKIAGLGSFETEKVQNNGAGFDSMFKSMMPTLPETDDLTPMTEPKKQPSIYDALNLNRNPKPDYARYLNQPPAHKYDGREVLSDDGNKLPTESNKFPKLYSAKTLKDPFSDKVETSFEETPVPEKESLQITDQQIARVSSGQQAPLAELGMQKEEIFKLCQKFIPVAAKHCYSNKVDQQYVDKCRGYNRDCAQFIAEKKPLGAIANAFSSGVGISAYNWAVDGIPYYPINEEGGIGNGNNGRADFGSWGGGYSDNVGVRDFWSQTTEQGGNWYEGVYGHKTGWHVPIAQSLGIEGGGGTQVNIPVNEHDLGNPIEVSNGYHVGPYIGLSEAVGVDWMKGAVSAKQGFAVPFAGVSANSGTAIGFPSIGAFAKMMGVPISQTYDKPIPAFSY
uniref:Peptidase C51 domain-containing protein n=1 Tax=Rhabditophanes sp. KR3021 TaxID=114890 RepID=A0AC35U4A9_9BILA